MAIAAVLVMPALAPSSAPDAVRTPSASAAAPPTAPAPRTTRADDHRFSDPVWYPLREAAWVSCSKTNCLHGSHDYHNYWAQDWTAMDFGAPVFAAGAGQVHIDRNNEICDPDGAEKDGTIVSIDHGGGVFSIYKHMDVDVVDGQWVTPFTQIGRTAAWGSNGCNIPYLHFEIHHGGRDGTPVPFNDIQACKSGNMRIWPDDLNTYNRSQPYDNWDQVIPYFKIPANVRWDYRIFSGDDSCIPTSNATPARPSGNTGSFTINSVTMNWSGASESIDETVARLQIFRPSTNEWDIIEYRELTPSSTSVTFTGLDVGRSYRVQVAHRNDVGSSEWSDHVEMIPGAPPDAPAAPTRLLSSQSTISYAWARSVKYGYLPDAYVVSIRSLSKGVWSPWTSTRKAYTSVYHRWIGLRANTTYQIKVRALSGAGPSPWSVVTTVKTKP